MLSRSERATEKRLLAALRRLESGDIKSAVLLKRRDAGKVISINYTTVAIEAERSPALIGTPNSRYSGVRNKIRAHIKERTSGRPKPLDPREQVRVLKARVSELEKEVQVLATRLNDAIAVARLAEARLEMEANRNRRAVSRAVG